MTYTAVVPARSGSKRVPHKNIKLLGDKPLLVWTLEACIQAEHVDEVIMSTDSMEYWEIAREYLKSDKLSLDFREPDEAGDTVKIFDYLKDKRAKLFGNRTGAFILTLPTVPLRRVKHVDEAIELFEASGKPVFSATNYGFPISFAFRMQEFSLWEPVFPDSPMVTGNTRSQNQPEIYHPNGAIYVRNINDLEQHDLMTLYKDAVPYFMNRADSVDIDAELDFKMAAALL
jgi:CMP-N,N'-diacetyllegionaminic acid synthase